MSTGIRPFEVVYEEALNLLLALQKVHEYLAMEHTYFFKEDGEF